MKRIAWKGVAQRLGLLGIGLAIGLVTLEIGVRVLGLAPQIAPIEIDQPYGQFVSSDDPDLPYVPRPGSPGISAWGIRDRDYAFEKPPGIFRIVVLGDSIGFGLCTENESLAVEDTFAETLERRLESEPLPGYAGAEVINLSVSGYDTRQEVAFFLDKGRPFHADLVLVAYCLNDDQDSSLELEALRANADFAALQLFGRDAFGSLFRASHLARLLWYRLAQGRAQPGTPDPAAPSRRREGFEKLGALAREDGFETLVVVFPYLDGAPKYRHGGQHARTHADAGRQGFRVLDLLRPFQVASGGHLPAIRGRCRGMHPDEAGHRIAASEIERALRAQYARPTRAAPARP